MKPCPECGEPILAVAVHCPHCQADFSRPHPRVTPAALADPQSDGAGVDDFEQRFLEFAYTTDYLIHAPTVAFALKIPIDEASAQLEDLAARDVLVREVDERGGIYYLLPGRQVRRPPASPVGVTYMPKERMVHPAPPPSTALTPYGDRQSGAANALAMPSESKALAGLLINAFLLPGLGTIIAGRSNPGVGQLLLFLIGVPLCLLVVGFPMVLAAWIWGLVTGIDMFNRAKGRS